MDTAHGSQCPRASVFSFSLLDGVRAGQSWALTYYEERRHCPDPGYSRGTVVDLET